MKNNENNEMNEVNLNLHIYARAALNSNADVTLEELLLADPVDQADTSDKEKNNGRSRNL